MDLSGQPMVARASGAAQRRKLRRLRAALRHEQQSIAMALASALHHSADKTTRAQHNAPRGQKNAGIEYYALSDEDVVSARGSWPPCLGEPRGPQERDQLRTVEQIAVYAPMVQILDAPVPQVVDHLMDVFKLFDTAIPEQIIAVPRIPQDSIPHRAGGTVGGSAVTHVPGRALFNDRHVHEWVWVVGHSGVYFWRVGTPSPGR